MTEIDRPTIYPRYCFHLSPTVNTWCWFRAAEIHALRQLPGFEGERFYFYKNLPIKWVRIVGPVVAIDDYEHRRVFTIDDSSGKCIEACATIRTSTTETEATKKTKSQQEATSRAPELNLPNSIHAINVGDVVDIKGGLSKYHDEMQIRIEKMVTVRCTAHELGLWRKRSEFRTTVLNKPWILENRAIRRCRKEAEVLGADSGRKCRDPRGISKARSSKQDVGSTSAKSTKTGLLQPRSRKKTEQAATAAQLKGFIRDGEATGKYSALGL